MNKKLDIIHIFKNILLLTASLVLSAYTSNFFVKLYDYLLPSKGGYFFMDFSSIAMIPSAYFFYLPLVVVIGSGKYRYWITGILLVPAFFVEIYLDPFHIYFPLILGFFGFTIGYLVRKGVFMLAGKKATV